VGTSGCGKRSFDRVRRPLSKTLQESDKHVGSSSVGSCPLRRDLRHALQRRYREGGLRHPRLLFNLLYSAQKEYRERVSTHSEFAASKQIHCVPQVQNGDQLLYPRERFTGVLAGKLGSQRRFFPRSNLASPPALPQIRLSRPSLSVSSSSIWPLIGPKGVHKNAGTLGHPHSSTRNSILSVPGRLPHRSQVGQNSSGSHKKGMSDSSGRRLHNKPEKISLDPNARPCLPRHASTYGPGFCPPSARENPGPYSVCPSVSTKPSCHSKTVSKTPWPHGSLSYLSTECSSSDAARPNVSLRPLESSLPKSVLPDFSQQSASFSSQTLERPSVPRERGPSSPSGPLYNSDHGRLLQGVGRSLPELQSSRVLDQETEEAAHQYSRNDGSLPIVPFVSEHAERSFSSGSNRQCLSTTVHQQDGRDQVKRVMLPGPPISDLVSISQDSGHSDSLTRNPQHTSRLALSSFHVPDGMGAQPLGCSSPIPAVGGALDGPVRYCSERANSGLLQLASRSGRLLGRRSVNAMEVNLQLRVSSIGVGTEGDLEDQVGQFRDHINRPKLAKQSMVSKSTQSTDRPSSPTSDLPRIVNPTRRIIAAPKSGSLVPGSLETKRQYLEAQGLSPEVAQTILASKAKGTYARYESGWRSFASWCKRKDYNPFDTSVSQILDYLQHCLTGLGLKHSTIRGRVFAIALFHRQFPLERLSRHEWVKAFLKGVQRLCPSLKSILPVWNLQLVLQALQGQPFEPMSSSDNGLAYLEGGFSHCYYYCQESRGIAGTISS